MEIRSAWRQVTTIVGVYMTRWKPKSYPRCLGDMFIGNDEDGWYEKCVQCSYHVELDKEAESTKKSARYRAVHAPAEKPALQSTKKYRLPSRVGSKESNLRILNVEEWQTLQRKILSGEMRTSQAERI